MENENPPCPECQSAYTYHDGMLWACPECGHEWSEHAQSEASAGDGPAEVRDAVGNILQDGDSVVIVKTMKVKGASGPLKAGTRVKNIRIVGGDHDIDCNIPGFGAMALKSSIVKKA